jgi:hypothetical protein
MTKFGRVELGNIKSKTHLQVRDRAICNISEICPRFIVKKQDAEFKS